MPNFKFFNVGKANEEITRLEAEVAAVKAESKIATDNLTEITAAAEANVAKIAQLESDLNTARTSVSSITAKAEKAEADLKVANEKIANPSQQIKEAAAKEAQKITAGQGQPPISAEKNTSATGGAKNSITRVEFSAMKPADAMAFFKAGGKITD